MPHWPELVKLVTAPGAPLCRHGSAQVYRNVVPHGERDMTIDSAPSTFARPAEGLHSPGVHTALSVLEALVVETPLGLGELASRLRVPKSSLSRVCSVLMLRGWVIRDSAGRYDLGIRAIGLSAYASEYPLVRAF